MGSEYLEDFRGDVMFQEVRGDPFLQKADCARERWEPCAQITDRGCVDWFCKKITFVCCESGGERVSDRAVERFVGKGSFEEVGFAVMADTGSKTDGA